MKPPAFQFYASDFLAGTVHMSQAEVGAYIRLLCHQWSEGSVPSDHSRLERICGGEVTDAVLEKFHQCEDGKLRNQRLEAVRDDRERFVELQRQKGLASAKARFNRGSTAVQPDTQPPVDVRFQPKSNSPSPSPSPTPDNTIPPIVPQGDEKLEAFRLRVGALLNRRPTTRWTEKEMKALKAVIALQTPEEDWLILEKRYASGDPYLRRDVQTLLNNWNVEIDRAKAPPIQATNGSHRNGSPAQPKSKSAIQETLDQANAFLAWDLAQDSNRP